MSIASCPHGELEFFFWSHARDKTKKKFLYFFTGLKTYYLSYSIYNTNVHINISVRG